MFILSILLVLGSVLAGAAAGALFPRSLVVPGAVLGGLLGLAPILMNILSRRRLAQGRAPAYWLVLVVALSAGLLAGVALQLLGPTQDAGYGLLALPPPRLTPWRGPLAYGAALAVTLYTLYHLRWWAPLVGLALPAVGALAATGIGYGALYHFGGGLDHDGALFLALLQGAPMGIIWGTALGWFDPAFSAERWQRLRKGRAFSSNGAGQEDGG